MQRIVRVIEQLSTPTWVVLALACLIPPGLGLVAEGQLLLALTAAAAPAGGVLGGGLAARWMARSLPLQLADAALRDKQDEGDVFRFRVRLGSGRRMRQARARVLWRSEGRSVELPLVLGELDELIGPWTLVALDPDGVVDGGHLDVYVHGEAGGQAWSTSATWEVAAVGEGRFCAPIIASGSRWRLAEPWDEVRAPEAPTPALAEP